jgi:hypothetical protein
LVSRANFERTVGRARRSAALEAASACRHGRRRYKAIRELLEAGQKALAAVATLLSVLIKTLPPAILAGLAAAAGAWAVNNVNF